jgi:hypothetical protein
LKVVYNTCKHNIMPKKINTSKHSRAASAKMEMLRAVKSVNDKRRCPTDRGANYQPGIVTSNDDNVCSVAGSHPDTGSAEPKCTTTKVQSENQHAHTSGYGTGCNAEKQVPTGGDDTVARTNMPETPLFLLANVETKARADALCVILEHQKTCIAGVPALEAAQIIRTLADLQTADKSPHIAIVQLGSFRGEHDVQFHRFDTPPSDITTLQRDIFNEAVMHARDLLSSNDGGVMVMTHPPGGPSTTEATSTLQKVHGVAVDHVRDLLAYIDSVLPTVIDQEEQVAGIAVSETETNQNQDQHQNQNLSITREHKIEEIVDDDDNVEH